MSKNKNKRKRQNRKLKEARGTLMKIEGQWRKVSFGVKCEICGDTLEHAPIKIPKPTGWQWVDGDCHFEVYCCCAKQSCVESATSKLRNALIDGIEVQGETPKQIFVEEE